jgi:hypothetical protein
MMNIVCFYEDDTYYTLVLPRANFRPWQYAAQGDEQLLVSPATVEMSGVFITPVRAHFDRITKADITLNFARDSPEETRTKKNGQSKILGKAGQRCPVIPE